jgi:methylase of polypeptide subunit release factors
MGTPEQFRRLREWLVAVNYTEVALCRAAGVAEIGALKSIASGRTVFAKPVDAQSLLVLLFLDGLRFPWSVVRSGFSREELSLLTDLGLLVPAISDAELCVATVALFPTEDIYVASDRLADMEMVGEGLPSDLVYSPLTSETRRFIGLMPRTPCESYLEMCAGTGIAALHAAKRFAGHAYSADITERSTRFAQFNAALNGLENFTAVQGDLYEPVAGKTFDMITAHPPYVPAESTRMVFRDGGADGEQITRGIISRLSDYLNPGGLFYLDCMMTDRRADAIEQRIRRMLGPSEDEFDVLVVRSGFVETKIYQADHLAAGRMSPDSFLRQNAFFKSLGIERLVAITALIHRRTTVRAVVTRQRTLSADTRADDLVWLMRYLTSTVEWGAEETRRLLESRPRANPTVELRARSVLRDGAWAQVDAAIATTAPFASESPCPAWIPSLLSRCDGQRTVREHFDQLRAEGLLPEGSPADNFAELIRDLADVQFLEVDAFPLPSRQRKPTVVA